MILIRWTIVMQLLALVLSVLVGIEIGRLL